MAIFLGKNMLGQRDSWDIEHSGQVNNRIDLSGVTTEQLERLINIGKGSGNTGS